MKIITTLSVLIPAVTGLYFYRLLAKPFRWFTWFMIFSTLLEILALCASYNHFPNVVLYNTMSGVEGLSFILILSRLSPALWLKKWAPFLFAGYILLFAWVTRFQLTGGVILTIRVYECILLIFLSGLLMINIGRKAEEMPLKHDGFVLASSVLLYFGSTIIIFGVLAILDTHISSVLSRTIFRIHGVLNMLCNIIFALSLWLNSRTTR